MMRKVGSEVCSCEVKDFSAWQGCVRQLESLVGSPTGILHVIWAPPKVISVLHPLTGKLEYVFR
jgi:hypothetical protein